MQASVAVESAIRPARQASEVDTAVLHCFNKFSNTGPLTGSTEIVVTVNAQGQATAVATPPGTEPRLAAAAQCAGATLRYVPALKDGLAVDDQLVLPVQFPSLPMVRGDLRRVINYCHAPLTEAEIRLGTRSPGELDARIGAADPKALEGSVNLIARVGKDGKIKEHQLPPGVLPWMVDAVACVVERLEFYPARLHTTLVDSWVLLPLHFGLTEVQHMEAEIAPPSLRSDDESIIAAYRKCYPAGQTAMVTIGYRITVARSGHVRRAELLESSGNQSLDDAGICILRNLTFRAARRNGRAVESTLNWPILVRPPD